MFRILATLRSKKRLLKEFVVRDLKARYVGSSMGFFWSVVFPIINLFVYMFVFTLVLNTRWSDTMGPYEVSLLMLSGIVVWVAFAETLSRSTNTLVENSNLIQKVVFPSEILPAFLSISSIINMCIGLPVVLLGVVYFAYLGEPVGHWEWPGGHKARDKYEARGGYYPIAENLEAFEARMKRIYSTQRDSVFPFTVGGSAVLGEDYTMELEPLVVEREQLEARLRIVPIQDGVSEGGEDIILTMEQPEGACLPPEGKGLPVLRLMIEDAPADAPVIPFLSEWRAKIGWGPNDYMPMKLGPHLIALPLLIALQILFSVGLGYFLSAINLYLRDVYHLIGVGMTVWMFGTPIFYPAALVKRAGYGWLLDLNPMHWLINAYRRIMLYGAWPDWELLMRFGIVAAVVFFLGASLFQRQKHQFPDLL